MFFGVRLGPEPIFERPPTRFWERSGAGERLEMSKVGGVLRGHPAIGRDSKIEPKRKTLVKNLIVQRAFSPKKRTRVTFQPGTSTFHKTVGI